MRKASRVTALIAGATSVALLAWVAPVRAAAPTASKPKIAQSGFTFTPGDEDDTFAGEVTAAAVVENPTSKVAAGVEVTLTFKDRGGRTIIDSRYTLEYIAPGDESYAVWSTTYPETKVPAKLTAKITDPGELVSRTAWAEDAQFSLGAGEFGADNPISIDDVAVEFADLRYYDSTVDTLESGLASSIIGTARSASGDELTGLDVTCAAFEGGEVVGGGNTVLPVIPEGEEAGIQATGLKGGLNPDEVRCSGRLQYLRARVGTLDDQLTVSDAGFTLTSIDEYTMGAVIENPSDLWAWGLDYAFDVLDANGRVIGSRTGSVPLYVAPQSSVYVSPNLAGYPTEFDGTPASLRVLATAGVFLRAGKPIKQEAGFDPAKWTFEFSDLALQDGHVTGTVTSHANRSVNALDISCGLFRDGAIVSAVTNAVDDTELGGQLEPQKGRTFEVGVALDAAAPDDISCVGTIGQLSDI
jgi:hypothetical protein